MPRAHRHFISGRVWHITHRCHREDFLLKSARDRSTCAGCSRPINALVWKFSTIVVTSNHIHFAGERLRFRRDCEQHAAHCRRDCSRTAPAGKRLRFQMAGTRSGWLVNCDPVRSAVVN